MAVALGPPRAGRAPGRAGNARGGAGECRAGGRHPRPEPIDGPRPGCRQEHPARRAEAGVARPSRRQRPTRRLVDLPHRAYERAETDHVAVRVHDRSLVLAPLGVLGRVDVKAGGTPLLGKRVSVLDEEVGGGGLVVADRDAEMELDPVASGEAVATTRVAAGGEAHALVVGQGDVEVADGEDRCDPFQAAHIAHPANASRSAPPPYAGSIPKRLISPRSSPGLGGSPRFHISWRAAK